MKRAMHALMLSIALAACATSPSADIDFDYDTAADFTALKTFGWMPATGNAAGDELLVKRIRSAVDTQLQGKGRTASAANPDFPHRHAASGKTTYGGSVGVGMSVESPWAGRGGSPWAEERASPSRRKRGRSSWDSGRQNQVARVAGDGFWERSSRRPRPSISRTGSTRSLRRCCPTFRPGNRRTVESIRRRAHLAESGPRNR